MPTVICMECNVSMKVEKIGVHVIELAFNPPAPYKIWEADALKCPSCGKLVVSGLGYNAIAEHFEDDFEQLLQKIRESEKTDGAWVVEWYERPQIRWEALPDYGDLYTFEQFKELVDDGAVMNDDGSGYFASATRMSREAVNCALIYAGETPPKPEFTHVMWFNK